MKFLLLFLLCSCAHQKAMNELSNQELADQIMNLSLLDTSLKSSVDTGAQCLKPFQKTMPPALMADMNKRLQEHFNYQRMHDAIRSRLLNSIDRKELEASSKQLHGDVWFKFLSGIQKANSKTPEEYLDLVKQIDDGRLDLKSKRAATVAAITDHAFTLNLVPISNSQVLKLMNMGPEEKLTSQQKTLLKWVKQELDIFNTSHVKGLFASTWMATEEFSEAELQELKSIRGSEVQGLLRASLEQEISGSYDRFFQGIKQELQAKLKRL